MIKKQLLLAISIGFWGSIVSLILILSFYNQPSINDDYCFGWIGRDFGIFKGAYLYYTNWSGRYSANVIMHLLPLTFSSNYRLFFIGPWILILFGLGNTLYFFKNAFRFSFNSFELWGLSFLFQGVCLYLIPAEGLFETIFWFPASIYFISFQCFLLFLNLHLFSSNFTGKNLIETILIFVLIGSSEFTLLIFSALFFLFSLNRLFLKKINLNYLIQTTVWLISLGIALFAPGNFTRSGTLEKNWVNIFLKTNQYFLDLLVHICSQPLFWMWIAFVILFSYSYELPLKKLNKREILLFSLFFFGGFWLSLFALSTGLGENYIPNRNFSLLTWYLLFLGTFIGFYAKSFVPFPFQISKFNIFWIAILFICFIPFSKTFKTFYREWKYDKLKNYALENQQRFENLRLSQANIVGLKPIKNKETLFFAQELSTDSTHLWCKCVANYYHKKAVYLKKETH